MNVNKIPPLEILYTHQPETSRATRRSGGEKGAGVSEGNGDRAEFSKDARLLAELMAELPGVPEVRSELVAALREKIVAGRYPLDPEEIADGILQSLVR